MDTWKGEKLHGADRRLTRAQLEECDREPTDEECLDSHIYSLERGGLGAQKSFLLALAGIGENANPRLAALLRERLWLAGVVTRTSPMSAKR